MNQDMFVIGAFVVAGLIIVWPEIVLQAVGLIAFMAAPIGLALDGTSAVVVAMLGLGLVALGRLVYTAKKAHQLLRLVHWEAADQVRVKRWL